MKKVLTNEEESSDSIGSLENAINKGTSTVNLEGKKIMWVEDDQFLNDIIARKLSVTKCILLHADEGNEALRIIKKEIPDVVMLDILLSGMDGFEILRRIKSDEKLKNIPVILLSNLGGEADIKKGKDLGAIKFIVKSTVTPDEIVENIKGVMNNIKK